MCKYFSYLVASVYLLASGTSLAMNLKPENNSSETQLCMAAASGSLVQFNQKLKETNLSKKHVVQNVKCNGYELIEFVMSYGKNSGKMVDALGDYKSEVQIFDVAQN